MHAPINAGVGGSPCAESNLVGGKFNPNTLTIYIFFYERNPHQFGPFDKTMVISPAGGQAKSFTFYSYHSPFGIIGSKIRLPALPYVGYTINDDENMGFKYTAKITPSDWILDPVDPNKGTAYYDIGEFKFILEYYK